MMNQVVRRRKWKLFTLSRKALRRYGSKGPLWRRSELDNSIGSDNSSSSSNSQSSSTSTSCGSDAQLQSAANTSGSIFGIEQYVNLCSSDPSPSTSREESHGNRMGDPQFAISNSSIFPVASHAWDHVNEMDGVGELQTLTSPAPTQRAKMFRGETNALLPQSLLESESGKSNFDEESSDDEDDVDFVDAEECGLGGVGPGSMHEEGSCSRCQSQQRRVIAAQNESGAMVPLLDLDAPFRFPATHITKRPKLSSMRLLACFDVHLGELVVTSYSENFGIDFEYSMDGKPYGDLRGKSIKALEGKATNIRGDMMVGFEMAARQNSRASGVVNVYTSRGYAKQCYMEWIPLCPNRSSLDDAQAGLPARQYLILLSHMPIRGYTDSEEKYRLRFIGEHVLPVPTASRRRADTSKTSRRCTRRQTKQNLGTMSASSNSTSIPHGSLPWGLFSRNEGHSGGEENDAYQRSEVDEIRNIVKTADFASTLLQFMENQDSSNVPLHVPLSLNSGAPQVRADGNHPVREVEENTLHL